MRSRTFALALLAAAAPAVLWSQASPAPPADHSQHHPAAKADAPAAKAGKAGMMGHCQEMMGHHTKMMEEMKAADARLDPLMTRLKAATGDEARLDALTAVVTELVAQRRGMHDRMASMPQMMMGHAMQHVAGGGAMDCPMMKGMGHPPAEKR